MSHLTGKLNEMMKTKIRAMIFILTSYAPDDKPYLECPLISLFTAFFKRLILFITLIVVTVVNKSI